MLYHLVRRCSPHGSIGGTKRFWVSMAYDGKTVGSSLKTTRDISAEYYMAEINICKAAVEQVKKWSVEKGCHRPAYQSIGRSDFNNFRHTSKRQSSVANI